MRSLRVLLDAKVDMTDLVRFLAIRGEHLSHCREDWLELYKCFPSSRDPGQIETARPAALTKPRPLLIESAAQRIASRGGNAFRVEVGTEPPWHVKFISVQGDWIITASRNYFEFQVHPARREEQIPPHFIGQLATFLIWFAGESEKRDLRMEIGFMIDLEQPIKLRRLFEACSDVSQVL